MTSKVALLPHISWLVDLKHSIRTHEGKTIQVLEFQHSNDDTILSAWATHFRNHYCLDSEIDFFRSGTKYSRAEYLNNIKLPDRASGFGPSIRAGDFGEIVIADYLEYLLNYWVPRTRYSDKVIRNESTKGSDIVGFKLIGQGDSADDTLALFEVKTQFSGKNAEPRLQDAVDGSAKDSIRRGESLNAIKQRLFYQQQLEQAKKIERFQNPEDRPYKEVYGAAALFSTNYCDETLAAQTDTSKHPNANDLTLLIIRGPAMMELVHELYRRVADEA